MAVIDVNNDDGFYIVRLGNEGKFNPDSLAEFNAALDVIDNDNDAKAIILTGEGKIFAQGLDLEYLLTLAPEMFGQFVDDCMVAVGRLLSNGLPVCSAVNGHAFGLGAMLMMASDYTVMRDDRGYFCLPEVDLKMVLIPSMNALVIASMQGKVLRDALLCGARLSGEQALAKGIVDGTAPVDSLIAAVKDLAMPMLGKDRATLAGLKSQIHAPILEKIQAAVSGR